MKHTFTIENIDGFQVVRDDLYPGGTKKRVLENIAHLFPEEIWVYPASYLGAAPYAMALVANELGKKVHLLLPAGETVEPADTFKKNNRAAKCNYRGCRGGTNSVWDSCTCKRIRRTK